MGLTTLDLAALAFFAVSWTSYHIALESTAFSALTLNRLMHDVRRQWMERMIRRDMRMVDAQIMASLQNGTAFFATTSVFAVGGALALLRSADDILRLTSDMQIAVHNRALWEVKAAGLAVIFVYAFFKFSWAYRLFNYTAILIGSAPPAEEADMPEAKAIVARCAAMATAAGRHFNRGQRAFFFALAYLGWFYSPWLLIGATAAVIVVMASRQFVSDARDAVLRDQDS